MILRSIRGESEDIRAVLISLNITVIDDNPQFGDYIYGGVDGVVTAIEVKQISQLMGDLQSGNLDVQLAGCLETYDRTILLIVGVARPNVQDEGKLSLYKYNPKSDSFERMVERFRRDQRKIPTFDKSYLSYAAFKKRIQELGVDLLESADYISAGYQIAAAYKNAQKKEHTVLRRYIRQKPILWTPDPNVEILVSISHTAGVRLSTKSARLMLERWRTPWGVLKQTPKKWQEIEGVGKLIAEGLAKALGKKVYVG